jgi:plasmid maintenance system antidote protein VapI
LFAILIASLFVVFGNGRQYRPGGLFLSRPNGEKNFMAQILDRIDQLKRGMNTTAFSRFLGVNQKTLDHVLKAERKPSIELVTTICEKCNVSADWLLGLENKNTTTHVSAVNGSIAIGSGNVNGGDCSRCPFVLAATKFNSQKKE